MSIQKLLVANRGEIAIRILRAAAGPIREAAKRGAIIGLANKECLVCAGELMLEEVRRSGATLLPVDSEHNAIFQVFDFDYRGFYSL